MYLTYVEYQTMGGALDEATFNDLEFEARTYVDWVTFNRLWNEEVIPERVKECIYHIIRLIENKLEALDASPSGSEDYDSGKGILSQSNDGVSITFNKLTAKEIVDTMDKELQDAIDRYLQGVRNSLGKKLLYRGLYAGE